MVFHRSSQKRICSRLRDKNLFEQSNGEIGTPLPQDFLNISDEELAKLYRFAVGYLEMDDSANAVRAFTLLCHLHPYISEFWEGLGLGLQELCIFEEALSAFLMAETLNPHCFDFYERGIVCALAMKDVKEARHIFSRLLAHGKKIDNFSNYKSRLLELRKELASSQLT